MKAVKHIDPPEWMIRQSTESVMRAIGGYDNTPAALFVGGCVRDELLARPVHDIDIATTHTPPQIISLLEKAGIKAVPTGIDHGTITAVSNGKSFEITTLRRDVETDGRHAVIAFTQDWAEDAQRRDFTFNTLLADCAGGIYDPTGQGVDDLERGRVVFVGQARERIREDYLRILRFFRFHAQIGKGAPDDAALTACRAEAGNMGGLSRERITQELFKLLSVKDPAPTLDLMFENKVLADLPDASFDVTVMRKLCDMQTHYDAFDMAARLFVLGGLKECFFEKYCVLSNVQKKDITCLSKAYDSFGDVSEKNLKLLIYRYKNKTAMQILFVRQIEAGQVDEEMVDLAATWEAPTFPITGEDLIAEGVPEGPALGRRLKELEDQWLERVIT
jgi:poly(A) polymerase